MAREIQLRTYQQDIVDGINKTAERGIRRQLVVASTGLGKSYTLVFKILQAVNANKKVLILVDQSDLVWQWQKYLQRVDESLRIGIEKAEYTAKKSDQIVIATVQTLGREGVKRIKKFPSDHFDECFVDEAHKSITPTFFRVLEYFGFGQDNFDQNNLLVACTATPYRSDGQSLGKLYDDIVANYDLRYAISEGWLCDFELYEVSTSTDLTKADTQGKVDDAVDNEERNKVALKAYKEFSDGEQALIYTASVDHAYNLAEIFEAEGIPSGVIEANTDKDERKQLLQDFKDKKIQCLLNYGTLTTGIDLPETSTLMLLRPISSKLLCAQILGRGLRPSGTAFVDVFETKAKRKQAIEASAKPACKVIDLYDKVANQNFAHIPSLFGLNNDLKSGDPKKFYKEVVEPLEEKAKEHGFDKTKVTDLDELELIVKNRKVDIQSLKTDPKIEQFTSRKWISVGADAYEIIYGEDSKALMIEADRSKDELLDKKEWNLLEYDTKADTTKKLQTFNSLSGAFKIADEYASNNGWDSKFNERADWMGEPPSEKQIGLLNKLYTYKTGFSEFRTLNKRYDNGHRQLLYKKTGEIITKGDASTLIQQKFNN